MYEQKQTIIKEIIPIDIEQDSLVNIITRDVSSYTHGFHKYPAKFIPQVPKWAIQKHLNGNKEKNILDPFCGSGTTLVEGALAGFNVIGVDIDPLSAMISKVKTTRIEKSRLVEISKWLVKEVRSQQKGTFIPACDTINHWFTPDAIDKLSLIRTVINRIPDQFNKNIEIFDIQDLFLICFSSIIRRVSNADNESQKTYVSHTKIKIPEEVNSLFFAQMDYFVDRAIKFSSAIDPNVKIKVINSSSSESLFENIGGKKIDLAITSPPYIKAIDYIYNQMVELFWIGDLFQMQTQEKQNSMKNLYIGNKQIQKAEYLNYSPFETILNINSLDRDLQKIFITDKKNGHKHSYITYKYFLEMEKHFVEINKCLKNNAYYVLVVGNSRVSEINVDTVSSIISIGERNGFKISNKWGYKIKNRYMRFDRKGRGGIIDNDFVLEFIKL
jgi:DNA modification methylase